MIFCTNKASVEKDGIVQGEIQTIYNYFCYPNSDGNEPKLDGTSNEDVQGKGKDTIQLFVTNIQTSNCIIFMSIP